MGNGRANQFAKNTQKGRHTHNHTRTEAHKHTTNTTIERWWVGHDLPTAISKHPRFQPLRCGAQSEEFEWRMPNGERRTEVPPLCWKTGIDNSCAKRVLS